MSKPKEIYMDGYDFYFWNYEEQTKMKHKVLRKYFIIWAHKLGAYNKSNKNAPCFFDCHGGCGAYLENRVPYWGSSILLAKIAEDFNKKYDKKINIFACEENKDIFENLKKVIKYNNYQSTISVTNDKFEIATQTSQAKKYFSKHPTLFFVDPFGYSLNITDITDLMKFDKCEIIFNFMFNFINRSVSNDKEKEKMNKLFGSSDWEEAKSIKDPHKRELFLVDLFKQQIKLYSGAKFVFPYKISFYDKKRTYYYLFHITDNYDGISIMKSCFADCNNGKIEFLGKRNGEISIFDMYQIKEQEIETYLCTVYKECKVPFIQICCDIMDDTLYLEKDIRAAIKEMEKQGKVIIERITSKKNGLSGNDVVIFSGDNNENN